jgi:Tfp pilus assembly protein PilP
MKPKIVIAICIVTIAAYTAYNKFAKVGPSESSAVETSFRNLALAIKAHNSLMAQILISPTFTGISKEDFLKVVDVPRATYAPSKIKVAVNGNFALVSYARSEDRGGVCEPTDVEIKDETWARDKTNPQIWQLQKLADNDKWFRTVECEKKKVVAPPVSPKDAQAPGTPSPGKGPEAKAMKKGERYNPAGKRDPFRPLIVIGGTDAEMMAGEFCEPGREKEFLEKFDLDTLKLTGIILGEKGPLALIETPDGNGYTVSMEGYPATEPPLPRKYLGKRCGKVSRIDDKQILLKEQIRKPGGKPGEFTTIETPMRLRTETEDADSTLPKEQIQKPGGMSGQSTIDSPKRLRREEG